MVIWYWYSVRLCSVFLCVYCLFLYRVLQETDLVNCYLSELSMLHEYQWFQLLLFIYFIMYIYVRILFCILMYVEIEFALTSLQKGVFYIQMFHKTSIKKESIHSNANVNIIYFDKKRKFFISYFPTHYCILGELSLLYGSWEQL